MISKLRALLVARMEPSGLAVGKPEGRLRDIRESLRRVVMIGQGQNNQARPQLCRP